MTPCQLAKWRGIYVLQADGLSVLHHVDISGTRAFIDGALMLTGGVTFYESPVSMDHVSFRASMAEDALNIVQSHFSISNTLFENSVSDAFDSDFSSGTIASTSFVNIGGDGLDGSGSTIAGFDLKFVNVTDKAVSAGEASEIDLSDIQVRRTGSAVVSKDGSRLSASNLSVEDIVLFAGMAYVKKPEYGPAVLIVTGSDLQKQDFLNQQGNRLVLDGKELAGIELDVDALYAAGPMHKPSANP